MFTHVIQIAYTWKCHKQFRFEMYKIELLGQIQSPLSWFMFMLATRAASSGSLNANKTPVIPPCCSVLMVKNYPWYQGSWGQHGAHLGPTGPRWAPCRPYEPFYLGLEKYSQQTHHSSPMRLRYGVFCEFKLWRLYFLNCHKAHNILLLTNVW